MVVVGAVVVLVVGPVVVVVAALAVVVVAEEAGTLPAEVRTFQVPPKAVMPAPTVDVFRPLKNRNNGWPLYVTWKLPSGRSIEPSLLPVTPAPATQGWLVSTGGHAMAHLPTQLVPVNA